MGRTSDAKDRLLTSAMELIHVQGFSAVGVAEICAHAGVKKGSFYHFFESKQALALEVVETFRRTMRDTMEAHLLGPGPPLERLATFLDGVYAYHVESCATVGRQAGCLLANLALEMSTHDAVIRRRVLEAFESQIGIFEEVLREAQKLGDAPPDFAVRQGAEMILVVIEGKILLSKLRDDPTPLKDLKEPVFQALGLRTVGVEATVP